MAGHQISRELGFHTATEPTRLAHAQCWACESVTTFEQLTVRNIGGKRRYVCDPCWNEENER